MSEISEVNQEHAKDQTYAEAGRRPRPSREDFLNLARKIRYDQQAAQAKLVELTSMLIALDLPTAEAPFNEQTALTLVRNTAHEYTDTSIADELALRGATAEFIDRALMVAADVRRAVEA